MDLDGLKEFGLMLLPWLLGLLVYTSAMALFAAWILPKVKGSRPRILPPQTRDIDDADVLREPDVSDREAA